MSENMLQRVKESLGNYVSAMERYDWAFVLVWVVLLIVRWRCYKRRNHEEEVNPNDFFPGALLRNDRDRARVNRQLQSLAERAVGNNLRQGLARGDAGEAGDEDVPTGEIRARLEVLMSRDGTEEVINGVYHPALLHAAANSTELRGNAVESIPNNDGSLASRNTPRLDPPWPDEIIEAALTEASRTPNPPEVVSIGEFITALRTSLEAHSHASGEMPISVMTGDFDAAVEEARRTGKMIFVLFTHPVKPTNSYFSFVYPHYPSPWSIAEAQSLLLNLFVLAVNTRSVSDQAILFFAPVITAPIARASNAANDSLEANTTMPSLSEAETTQLKQAHKASVKIARRLRVKLTAPVMILADTSNEVDAALADIPMDVEDEINTDSNDGEQKDSLERRTRVLQRVLPLQIITWVQTLQHGFHHETHQLLSKRSRLLTPAARKYTAAVNARSLFVIFTRLERGPYQLRPRSPRSPQASALPVRRASGGANEVSSHSSQDVRSPSAEQGMTQAQIDEMLAQTLQEIFAHENSPQLRGQVTPLNLSPPMEPITAPSQATTQSESVSSMGESWMYSNTPPSLNDPPSSSPTLSNQLSSSPGLRPANDFSRIMAQISDLPPRLPSLNTQESAQARTMSSVENAATVLREQNREYEEMLQEDIRRRAQILESKQAAEQAENEARVEKERQLWRVYLEKRWQSECKLMRSLLPAENCPSPPQTDSKTSGLPSSAQSVMLSVRLTDGRRISRRFAPSISRIGDVFLWIACTVEGLKFAFDEDMCSILETASNMTNVEELQDEEQAGIYYRDNLSDIVLDWGLGQLQSKSLSLIDRAGVLKNPLLWPKDGNVESAWQAHTMSLDGKGTEGVVEKNGESKIDELKLELHTSSLNEARKLHYHNDGHSIDNNQLNSAHRLFPLLSLSEAWTRASSSNPTLDECGIVRPLLLILQAKTSE